jgi:integrase
MAKGRRRGRGEGTITQLRDGRWQARVTLGRDEHGKRLRKAVYGATRAACATELAKLLGKNSDGELLTTTTPTLGTLLNDWYATKNRTWRPNTRRPYRAAIDRWISPALKALKLEHLKPLVIQRWANQATKDGESPRRCVVVAHVVLKLALKWAMAQRLVTYNAATLVTVPRPTPKVIPLTREDAGRVLAVVPTFRLGAMIAVALVAGLRKGEVSGLSWPDIDIDARTIRVRQQVQPLGKTLGGIQVVELKTAASRRTLTMPELLVPLFRARRQAQREERLRAGARWAGNHDDLVFTTEQGRPVYPDDVHYALRDVLTAAKVGVVTFHALRHTYATLMLADGEPLERVSKLLGHASVVTTADIYSHFVPEVAIAAAARADKIFGTGTGG